MKKRIANAEFEFPDREWEMVSDNAKDLIKGLLVVDPEKRMNIEEVMQHPWLISDAPDIPLFSPHFIKSKDALATALAAGNRRLRTVELAPVETAYNPILIRAKQRQKSTTFTPAESIYQGDAANLEAPVDMSLQINILRTALCHLLNLLHMKSEDRIRSSDWEAWENLVRVTPALSHYARYDSKHITNQIALSLQKTIVAMKE
ncbi:Oidioi.mRNA.OKI2018_I69.chr2.g6939.t1.cds [Oikopleura dioica]|uniref:Oidioi.mRNA.OKI2018_I69.chr2.g6925.t1.cds n=1 Tax=Oikopleura dioica TaxID=34765 RepID=A0ABN7T506_OIKDI|nr:Oidioi.mRNA.OKI2018_I69.chr2.g6925.t1.cds [Oikopleura dioica]CAG5112758.1 Oidioi.mRNA.OKI2018_I69.chr2.g6939.t1.cds [Oikopleura dioica]